MVCGFGNKGVNIMNFVDLSGIYQVSSVAYVFCERIVIPPGVLILDSNWRLPSSLIAFREEGGL